MSNKIIFKLFKKHYHYYFIIRFITYLIGTTELSVIDVVNRFSRLINNILLSVEELGKNDSARNLYKYGEGGEGCVCKWGGKCSFEYASVIKAFFIYKGSYLELYFLYPLIQKKQAMLLVEYWCFQKPNPLRSILMQCILSISKTAKRIFLW